MSNFTKVDDTLYVFVQSYAPAYSILSILVLLFNLQMSFFIPCSQFHCPPASYDELTKLLAIDAASWGMLGGHRFLGPGATYCTAIGQGVWIFYTALLHRAAPETCNIAHGGTSADQFMMEI